LLAAAALLGPTAAAAPAADDCAAPSSGYHACVQVRYEPSADGTVQSVRATATLVQRVDRCSTARSRRVAIRVDGAQVATDRPGPSCRAGVARWRTVFSPGETSGWRVKPGSKVVSSWDGTTAVAGVTIAGGGGGTQPQKGRTIRRASAR
jgi:hypothetical protein